MAATCMAVCKGSRKKIRGIFISSCHLPVAVECDIVILSEPGPIPQAPVGQFCRHNLSPRGDGNAHGLTARCAAADTTYPREGTETVLDEAQSLPPYDTTYPREGTETWSAKNISQKGRHNLSPRGDGNRRRKSVGRAGLWTQLIPARGRKQIPEFFIYIEGLTQLIPARGRKLTPYLVVDSGI